MKNRICRLSTLAQARHGGTSVLRAVRWTVSIEILQAGMFDQACLEQYGKFQVMILGDIETDILFRKIPGAA